jgi:hypothetical protein
MLPVVEPVVVTWTDLLEIRELSQPIISPINPRRKHRAAG